MFTSATPGVADAGPVISSCDAAAGLTVTTPLPFKADIDVSAAFSVWPPALTAAERAPLSFELARRLQAMAAWRFARDRERFSAC